MMLEEKRMPRMLRIEQLSPLKLTAAFRTPRLGQAAEVIETERAFDRRGDGRPIDDGRGRFSRW